MAPPLINTPTSHLEQEQLNQLREITPSCQSTSHQSKARMNKFKAIRRQDEIILRSTMKMATDEKKNMQINMQVALDTTCTSHKQKKISPSRLQQRRLRKNAMKSLDRRDLSSTITESRLQFSRTSSFKSSCKWLRTEHPQTCTNKQTNKQTCTNIKWLRTEHAQTEHARFE